MYCVNEVQSDCRIKILPTSNSLKSTKQGLKSEILCLVLVRIKFVFLMLGNGQGSHIHNTWMIHQMLPRHMTHGHTTINVLQYVTLSMNMLTI